MGDFNAVQSTIRWRAQVRSSKTIKIRQLSMIVSILVQVSFFLFSSFGSLIFSPSKSSHKVNQIIFSPSTVSTRGSADGNVSRSVQTTLVRLDVRNSTASSVPLAGFQMLSVVQIISKSPIPPHAEEIIIINLRSGRGIRYLSASRTVTIKEGSQ